MQCTASVLQPRLHVDFVGCPSVEQVVKVLPVQVVLEGRHWLQCTASVLQPRLHVDGVVPSWLALHVVSVLPAHVVDPAGVQTLQVFLSALQPSTHA